MSRTPVPRMLAVAAPVAQASHADRRHCPDRYALDETDADLDALTAYLETLH